MIATIYDPKITYNIVASGKLKPNSWEEHTLKTRIWLLVNLEAQEPEEFDPNEWDEITCTSLQVIGNQQYTMICKLEDEYFALALAPQ
jgi:hypothetical protein